MENNNEKTVHLSVGEAIVKFLDNQYLLVDDQENKYVKGVLAIYGHGNVLGLGEALTNAQHNLQVIQGRNEQGMGHIATGFAKQSLNKSIFAVTSSIGPGAANMITAAATASANHIPVLFLPSDVYADRQPDPVLQQIEMPYNLNITTNDAFKAVSKFWDRIYRPEQLMRALLGAFQTLTNPATHGAVTICLPQDVQGQCYSYPLGFFKKRVWNVDRIQPSEKIINQAVEMICSSKKVMMIIGGGALYSEATKEVTTIANKFKIPFGLTQAGKGISDFSNFYNLGGIGVTGTLSANVIAQQADCILGLGTRYTDFTTGSKSQFYNNPKFININLSQFDANKMEGFSVIGDVKLCLQKIIKKLVSQDFINDFEQEIKNSKTEWQLALKEYEQQKIIINNFETEKTVKDFQKIYPVNLSHSQAFLKIRDILNIHKKNAIVVGAAGSLPAELQRLWNVQTINTYHVEYGYSCMGYEIAAGLGAKIANSDKEVYVFLGDGSFQMLHSELVTSLQEQLKITILLFDNSGFGCIDNLQTSCGIKSNSNMFRYRNKFSDKFTEGELIKINYAQIAAGYGCTSYVAKNEEELINALAMSFKDNKTALIDIKVSPKSMTKGYDTWWRVGLTENNTGNKLISESQQVIKKMLIKSKKY